MKIDHSTAGAVGEPEVLEYLRAHPDFLVRNPQALEFLEVPHACGGAVSLVEYQTGVLRDQTRELRARVQELIVVARGNEDLARRVHELTLELLDCRALDETLCRIYSALRDGFGVEWPSLRLLRAPRGAADRALGEFGDAEHGAELLAGVLEAGKPLCGRVGAQQAEYLFGEAAGDVRSAAMVALGAPRPFGVLALGSGDAQRFHPGMGTVFLRQLGDVVGGVIAPHLDD